MHQTYNTVKHRWARVKDFINYTQPKDFWVDINTYLRQMTKNFIEVALDEEMIHYHQHNLIKEYNDAWIIATAIIGRSLDTTFGPR